MENTDQNKEDRLKDAEKKAQKDIDLIRAYKTVFKSEEGKRVLHDMMKSSHYLTTTVVPGDPQMTAFNEGKRSTIVGILNVLEKDESKILEFLKYAHEREKEYEL